MASSCSGRRGRVGCPRTSAGRARTSGRLAARASADAAEDAAALLAPELGWDEVTARSQVEAYRASVAADVALPA